VFSGVPSGQVKTISLWKNDPQFVRVRISVNDETPVLQGTTASISGVGFTGVSQISLDGARKGAPAIGCPDTKTPTECPYGVPVIPTKLGGLGAILNSAPQLLERLSTLTERLTGLLTDRNQASIAGILENTNRLTDALADRGPEIAATLAQTRVAIQQAGDAAQQFGVLAKTTNGVLSEDVKPAMANLNKAITSAQQSAETLNAAIGDARPGLQAFSKTTIPEANRLVRDLRTTAAALSSVAEKVDQQGASSLIGQQKLPDYKGK
jgi:phospholipid/cholesterol/gamma-HCH transport system substrate-binding protein